MESDGYRRARLRRSPELGQAFINEVETNMCRAIVSVCRGCAFVSQPDRLACNFALGERAGLGYVFDHVTVAVACRKIHFAVYSAGIFAQRLLDHAHGLDELAPVHGTEKSEAADGIADRHLVGGLLLVLRLHQLLNCQAGLG